MRKLGLMLAISLALGVPCAKAANTEVLRNLVNKGNSLMRAHHFPEAINAYEEALKLDPGNAVAKSNIAEAHNNWGIFYCSQKKYTEAKAEWDKCLQLAPNHPNAKRNLAILNNICEREGINLDGAPQDYTDPNLPQNFEKTYPHAALTNTPETPRATSTSPAPPVTVPAKLAPAEESVASPSSAATTAPQSGPSIISVPSSGASIVSPPSSGPSIISSPSSGPSIISSPSSGPSIISSPSSGPSLLPPADEFSSVPQPISAPPKVPSTAGIPMVAPSVPPVPPSQRTPTASSNNSGPQIVSPIPDSDGPFLRKQSNPLFPSTPEQFHGIFAPSQAPQAVPNETTSQTGSPSLDDQLTQVELKVYGKKQSDMTVLQRLEKIERETVGQPHGGTIVERINFLKQSFGLN